MAVASTKDVGSQAAPAKPANDFGFLPIPRRCRYDPERPFEWSTALNWMLALGATVTVAPVYYCQPILVQLSQRYAVEYETVTRVPSLVQGGYLVGLVFITPLGDLLPRRPLLLTLILVCSALTIGQALAPDFSTFEAITFLVGISTVTPQVLVPLTADLAPAARRASAVSVTVSGLIGGMVWGRLISGLLARYTPSPNNVFWLALGQQILLAVLLWWRLPAYPAKKTGLNYPQILWSMVKLFCTKPVLTQACLLGFCSCFTMVAWWTTLTFLLDGDPFRLNAFEIGLFGLTGICAIAFAPFAGRLTDIFHPWATTLVALIVALLNQAIALGAARLNLAPVIICCILVDIAHQTQTIGNQQRFFAVDPLARSRVNGVYMTFTFLGQTAGSSAGPRLFLNSGWRSCYALTTAMIAAALVILFLRGPHATGWIGWDGVWSLRKERQAPAIVDVEKKGGEVERRTDEEETKVEGEADTGSPDPVAVTGSVESQKVHG
ncbi:hypothetical protein Rhopal_001621-T1 [Rhodotorula paludigena]|uniref:Major facilitator superfamily (MFS) profile domain-containing protein n=1 Tax=Rhodotorula paludigena TaxID=86838 RepID=A0AAV5G826_9BASI|nr:hypothetical protein Rhopal_001621-T1 [Rhodotorula paludigena]